MKKKWIVWGAMMAAVVVGLTACTIFANLPKAVLKAIPQMGQAPLEVSFDISESRGQVFTLNFGDGTPEVSGTDFSTPIEHTYGDPGDYVATLVVEDARGNVATDHVTVKVQYPDLFADLDVSVQTAPDTFAFDGSGSVGFISEYLLDFGDGTVVGGDWASAVWPMYHTYTQTGTYYATLWVQDIYGQDDQTMVPVEVPAP